MSTPRRRGRSARATLLFLPLLPLACESGDDTLDPQLRAPEVGTYTYDATVYTEENGDPVTFEGSLDITVSSEDSIIGTWSVPGYSGAQARGIWNITAYTLPADPQPPIQGSISHRVWRGSGGALSCNLTYVHEMPADTFTSSGENDCTLVRPN